MMEEYYKEKRKLIEKAIDDFLSGYPLKDWVEDIVKGGKRLRGVLCILTCESLGGKTEDAIDAAVAIELIHSASLTHDDIIDEDKERRGKPVYYITHGIKKAVLVPHMLCSHAFYTLHKYGTKAMEVASYIWSKVVEGEVYDVLAMKPYEQIALLKSGGLFSIATVLGAIAADAHKEDQGIIDLCKEYGEKLGLAYQIADDYVDCMNMKFEPSTPVYLSYIGVKLDKLENITKIAMEFTQKAMSKLEEKIREAEQVGGKIGDGRLKDFVRFAVDMMLKKGGYHDSDPCEMRDKEL